MQLTHLPYSHIQKVVECWGNTDMSGSSAYKPALQHPNANIVFFIVSLFLKPTSNPAS
jgi:hypothetical protein